MSAAAVAVGAFTARYQAKLALRQRPPQPQRRPATVYEMPPTEVNGVRWDRSAVCALAFRSCHACHGSGLRVAWSSGPPRSRPCNCVYRTIFRAVMRAYRYRREFRPVSGISFRFSVCGRKSEEFLADVWLLAKRTLDAAHWPVFVLHCVEGQGWRACAASLGIDRGNFFHSVYRIEQQLGRAFRELRPYALFPVEEYFDGTGDHPVDYFARLAAESAFNALWTA